MITLTSCVVKKKKSEWSTGQQADDDDHQHDDSCNCESMRRFDHAIAPEKTLERETRGRERKLQ